MILFINTTRDLHRFGVITDQKSYFTEVALGRELSTKIFSEIIKLLKKQKADWQSITKVIVATGPSTSYTGQRIGVSVANALAYGLNVPVYGFSEAELKNFSATIKNIQADKKTKFTRPALCLYAGAPHITKRKAK